MPQDSPGTLVFRCQRSWRNTMGSHSINCHPAEVTFPTYPSQLRLVLDLATPRDARLSWP